ncbi:MAG: hypothetical protein LC749_17170, partial [Actinobacteria bacterium]|nr:hypothetical protein [Actinomycetota bacterium]
DNRQSERVDQRIDPLTLVRQDLADLRAQNERLATENERVAARVAILEGPRPSLQGGTGADAEADRETSEEAVTRRGILRRMGSVAAAGVVGAAGALLVGADPAGAGQGNMQYGNDNNAGDFTTQLRSVHPDQTLIVLNEGTGSLAGAALWGRIGTTGASAFIPVSAGVVGTAAYGRGVFGGSERGYGVEGYSEYDIGVYGSSGQSVSLWAGGAGRLFQALRTAGAPTLGTFLAGEQIRDANGELWLCVVDGSPGTWRRAATVYQGTAGGSMNLLARPIRLYDSRVGTKLAPMASVDVQVTGTVVNGVSVPAGAVGVVGNVTVTETVAPSGYLTLYPQGSPPSPATSNVNWFAANQDLNAAAVVGLNPANGKLTIHNGMVGGSNPTHVVFDATAFVF